MDTFKLHPALVHFPVAFLMAELPLLVAWRIYSDGTLRRFAGLAFRAGYVGLVVAMAAGLRDAGGLKGMSGDAARRHLFASIALFAVCTLRAIFLGAASKRGGRPGAGLQIAASAAGVAVTAAAAYFGGRLVFT